LDWLVLLPLSMAVTAMIVIRGEIGLSWFVTLSVAALLADAAYTVIMTAKFGQTLGKMALGVKVVRCDGAQLSCKDSMLRYAPYILIGIAGKGLGIFWLSRADRIDLAARMTEPQWITWATLIWTVAELIVLASNSKRRAIHDFIASTEVVVKKYETS